MVSATTALHQGKGMSVVVLTKVCSVVHGSVLKMPLLTIYMYMYMYKKLFGTCKYQCRFRPMDNLSGGEKTVAALALLFAIHR